MYPAHTIMSFDKAAHASGEDHEEIHVVNPYDSEDEPLFYALYNLGIFLSSLS